MINNAWKWEKNISLNNKNNKEIKILRPNQKIYLNDNKNQPKIIKFIIELNKKEIHFARDIDSEDFKSKLLEKFKKKYL